MAKDADAHAAEDRKKRDEIEARNRADAMVYNVEKMLKEHRDKIGEDEAQKVEKAIQEVKDAMTAGGAEGITKATDNLTQASHKLAEAMYKSSSSTANGAGAPPPPPAEEAKKDNVVDAEFVDVDDKK